MGKLLKKYISVVCAMAAGISMAGSCPAEAAIVADNGDGTFTNPVIFSDVPDEDIIRVGDTYYMISTTMHLSPGAPIMKSYDLVNWEIVNYVYDYLETDDARTLKNGKSDYAYGQWAASIRYDKYQKRYYVTFSSQTTPKSYFFVTDDIENGSCIRSETDKCYDSSMMFVDTGSSCEKYMIIPVTEGNVNATYICSLNVDEKNWKVTLGDDRRKLIDNNNYENPPAGLKAEGVHAYKIGEYYYFFMIQGASNPVRQQICWRSKELEHGTFEVKKVFTGGIVDENGKTVNSSWGIAQGGIVDTPDGRWYSIMFQDYHSVGRVPCLVPVTWGEDGWPVFGNDGKSVDKVLEKPVQGMEEKSIVESDEFDNQAVRRIYDASKKDTEVAAGISVDELESGNIDVEENEFEYNGSNLKLVWQWNHNPNNNLWSLTDREGYLRLKSGLISSNIRNARNTLTQRTYGPTSGAVTAVEVGNMKDGDVAGLTAFQNQYGYVGVKMEDGKKYLVMHRATKEGDADGQEQESVELTGDRVYLKVNCDFREDTKLNQTWRMKDEAYFYYSLDGANWDRIGDTLKMSYDWPDFMGYRFGLFYFSTENCGGYVDFDYFHVDSVDGKKSELNKLLSKVENLSRNQYCTDSQWNELKEAAAKAKEVLPKLPDNEDELSLTQVEENNNNANVYSVISALNKAIDSVKNAKAPDTSGNADNNSQGNQGSNLGQTQAQAPSPSHSGGSAASGEAVAGDNGTVSSGIAVRAAGYTLKGNTLYLAKGNKTALKAVVLPADVSDKGIRYSSDRKKVAVVSKKGIISAKAPGNANITITSGDGKASKTIKVVVLKRQVINRTLKAGKSINVKKGDRKAIVIKKLTAKTTSRILFRSADKKIAAVDKYGVVSGKKNGKTTIRLTCGRKKISIQVRVIK